MTENNFMDWYTLHYEELFLVRYLILYVCVDHGTIYKFYLKIKKKNNTAHF